MADWKLHKTLTGVPWISRYPHGTHRWDTQEPHEVLDNFVYEGELRFTSMLWKGGANFVMNDGTGVNMLPSDFAHIVPKLVHGRIYGKFTWYKQGTVIGIKLIEDDDGET